ncbi:putative Ca2+/H+ antiporter (TMEM165/GDT1 family) [Sphingobium fontiphilum]|uniref:GDT1 family protein n=1 Tax=Sphingobium fontiphilum TaxID=944425 RepID=A0A7W6DPF5_9SPHN|nr:TMEM165/GDT1 family protein [Sphingobium fontiphilum]MBB3983608.1 putative Ca2+/H+ antiporter (TMEM165/GDT1 family) [Sphingobium fontiphilum]
MDALLTALLGCLLGEIGDKSQLLLIALAMRFNRNGVMIAAIAVAAIANAALSAAAGAFIAPMLATNARILFLALALIFLGGGLLMRVRQPDMLEGWRLGAFLTSALGLFILGFGDGPQFLILGVATRTGEPMLAALGGAIGVIAAQTTAVLMRERLLAVLPIRAIRLGGGALVLAAGFMVGATALSLT